MNLETTNNVLQTFSHLVTILGLPLAIYLVYKEKRRERLDREYGTYNALDEKYLFFLELCLQHPELDVFDHDFGAAAEAGIKQRKEQIMFAMLISILERSFLMYFDQSTQVKRDQWIGWEEYIKEYCRKANFRTAWRMLSPQFDRKFVQYVNSRISEITQITKSDNI